MRKNLKEHLEVLQTAIKEENDPAIQARIKKVQAILLRAVSFRQLADSTSAEDLRRSPDQTKETPKLMMP